MIFFIICTYILKYDTLFYPINSKNIDSFNYFNLEDLKFSTFSYTYDSFTRKFTIQSGDKKLIVAPENTWVIFDTNVIHLPLPVKIIDNKIWIPFPLLNELLFYFFEKKSYIKENCIFTYDAIKKIKKIVIDAGHGGKDPGAIGKYGTKEKDITLHFAKILAKMLKEKLDIESILTRDKDVFVSLGERARIANKSKGDLFLSIHCNAASNPKNRKACGTEVYFLSPAKTDWERAVEARENASLEYEVEEKRDELESILWDVAQTEFLKESNVLAGKIVNAMKNPGDREKGVRQANFYVLRKIYMPACLVEIDFISNPKIEKRLVKEKFQLEMAKKLVLGIKEFKEWYEKQMVF